MIESERRVRAAVLGLVLLALALRIGAIVTLRAWEHPNAMEHEALAFNLVNGNGFAFTPLFGTFGPSSVQSPTYPLILAGMFLTFGMTPAAYTAAMVLNAALGALAVWLTYLLARTLGGSATVGLLAAAACAFWPTQIYAATHAQAIPLITVLLSGSIVLFYRAVRSGSAWTWVAFSALGCLAALTEPVLLPAMAFTGLLILAWRRLDMRLRVRNAAILLAAAIVIIGPWTLRNRLVHDRWVPVKNTFWVNTWKGNNPHATGTDRVRVSPELQAQLRARMASIDPVMSEAEYYVPHQYDMLPPEQVARLTGLSEIEQEDVYKDLAKSWIAANPGRYFELCLIRLGKTLWVDWDNPKSYSYVYFASKVSLTLLSAIGLIAAWRRGWSLLWPALVVGTSMLTITLTVTAARFSLPFEPLQLSLASVALVAAWDLARGRARSTPGSQSPAAEPASAARATA